MVAKMKLLHEAQKKDVLKIKNNQCSHLGCFSGREGRIWKGKLLDSEAEFTLDYAEFVRDTFKKEFFKMCRKEVNKFHSVPVGNSKIVQDEPYLKKAIAEIYFSFPRDGCPVVLYQQGSTEDCLFCGLASALEFLELTKQHLPLINNVSQNAIKIKLIGNLHMM